MSELPHDFAFDPSYGYDLDSLLAIEPPSAPPDFAAFWSARYERALQIDPRPVVTPSDCTRPGWRVSNLAYRSTDDFSIRGWLLEPTKGRAAQGFLVGHGYGGFESPCFDLPCADAVYLVPCLRGLCRSTRSSISQNPLWHVLHNIHQRDRYILGGCAEDIWTGISALLQLKPHLQGRINFMGISFSGGIGALALPWDARVVRGHLNVPTFGHHPLRLRLPTTGSGAAVQALYRRHSEVVETLAYYDAAVAARYIHQPMHLAAALFDPVVAPPGQFAIHNALAGPKELFVLTAGHFEHPESASENQELLLQLSDFFGCAEPGIAVTG